jgi:hypothetical protein
MPKRSSAKSPKNQSQKKAKLTLQEIEEKSIDQLFAQPIPVPAFKESLEKLLAANNEEIARLTQLNDKILECLDRIYQQEPGWSKLPEKIWLKVLQNLEVKDVNTVHLVCRNLHQIANLHANPKFSFKEDSTKDFDSLVQSSRIFRELEFSGESGGQWLHPEKFQLLEDYLSFTGAYLKKFNIDANYWGVKVDPKIVQKLLNLLPNLQDLELNYAEIEDSDELIKWELKSTKIERVTINHCSTGILRLLESLGKCAIKVGVEKTEFFYWTWPNCSLLPLFI